MMETIIFCLLIVIMLLVNILRDMYKEIKKRNEIIRLQDNWLKENNIIKKY
jgi:hypothetical protein